MEWSGGRGRCVCLMRCVFCGVTWRGVTGCRGAWCAWCCVKWRERKEERSEVTERTTAGVLRKALRPELATRCAFASAQRTDQNAAIETTGETRTQHCDHSTPLPPKSPEQNRTERNFPAPYHSRHISVPNQNATQQHPRTQRNTRNCRLLRPPAVKPQKTYLERQAPLYRHAQQGVGWVFLG